MKIEVCEAIDEFTEDDDFAYKDGKFYTIMRSKKTYCAGMCMGKMRVIVDNGEVLQWIYPMMGTAGDYKIMNDKKIEDFEKIVKAYAEYKARRENS